jgi:O-antigen/teichoic acid export membrane protein
MPRVRRVRATDEARSYGRRASLLSIGVGITGLITYLYFAIASHELSRDQYGQVAVLWSAVFIVVSVLQRPVEQLLSRTVSENLAHGTPIGHTVRVAATIQLAVAVGFDIVALALRTPIQDHLLDGNSTLYWIGVGAITAYGASYFARGFLAGSHRLTIYALQIISESVARTAFPFAVALGIASGQTAVALGIVAAPTLSLIVVPFAFLRRFGGASAGDTEPARAATAAPTDEFTLARGGRFAAAVFLIMLSEQTFLNAGVLLTNATVDAAAAGFVFNILMIARAPLQLFQAVQTSLLPHLTTLGSRGEEKDFRASIRVTLLAIAGFAALVTLALLIDGPHLMQVAFGKNHTYDRADLVVVAIGMGLYLSAATLNQAALARGQVRRASICWVACAITFVVWTVLPIVSSEVTRVVVGYLGAATLLCSVLYWLYRQPLERAEVPVKPGSTEELELQLASADEAG